MTTPLSRTLHNLAASALAREASADCRVRVSGYALMCADSATWLRPEVGNLLRASIAWRDVTPEDALVYRLALAAVAPAAESPTLAMARRIRCASIAA